MTENAQDEKTETQTESAGTTETTEKTLETTPQPSEAKTEKTGETTESGATEGEAESKPQKTALSEALAKEPLDKKDSSLQGKDGPSDQEQSPISYEDFTVPEGIEFSPDDMTRAKTIFAEGNLPQDQAQKYLDLHIEELNKHAEELQKRQIEGWNNIRQEWRDTFQADEEIGGNKADTSIKHGVGLLRSYGTPGLIEAIDRTGIGDHPEFIRFLHRIHDTHIESAKPVPANEPTQAQRAERRYTK
jgi:hypothetical protein